MITTRFAVLLCFLCGVSQSFGQSHSVIRARAAALDSGRSSASLKRAPDLKVQRPNSVRGRRAGRDLRSLPFPRPLVAPILPSPRPVIVPACGPQCYLWVGPGVHVFEEEVWVPGRRELLWFERGHHVIVDACGGERHLILSQPGYRRVWIPGHPVRRPSERQVARGYWEKVCTRDVCTGKHPIVPR